MTKDPWLSLSKFGRSHQYLSIFRWLNPFLWTGSKRSINKEDLFKISLEAESQALGNKLEFEWIKELEKRKKAYEVGASYNPNLTKAIIRAFLPGFISWGILAFFVDIVFRIPQPLLMCWFIRYFSSDDHAGLTYANVCSYGAGIILMSALCTITNHQYFFGVNKTGMMLRVANCSIIYRKVFQNYLFKDLYHFLCTKSIKIHSIILKHLSLGKGYFQTSKCFLFIRKKWNHCQ